MKKINLKHLAKTISMTLSATLMLGATTFAAPAVTTPVVTLPNGEEVCPFSPLSDISVETHVIKLNDIGKATVSGFRTNTTRIGEFSVVTENALEKTDAWGEQIENFTVVIQKGNNSSYAHQDYDLGEKSIVIQHPNGHRMEIGKILGGVFWSGDFRVSKCQLAELNVAIDIVKVLGATEGKGVTVPKIVSASATQQQNVPLGGTFLIGGLTQKEGGEEYAIVMFIKDASTNSVAIYNPIQPTPAPEIIEQHKEESKNENEAEAYGEREDFSPKDEEGEENIVKSQNKQTKDTIAEKTEADGSGEEDARIIKSAEDEDEE